MKKLMKLLLSLVLMSLFVLPVLGASDVNAEEQKVLDKLTAGVTIDGKTVDLSAEELNLAKNFFMRDEIDLTAADVAGLLTAIDAAAKIMQDAKVSDITKLSTDDKLALLKVAQDAVAAVESVELTFAYDFDTNIAQILGAEGVVLAESTVTTESTVIKDTANNLSVTWILLGALSLVIIGGVGVAGKKGLLNNA